MNPIKSQHEADEVFNFLVEQTILKTNCSKEQAEKRINALLASDVLKNGHPDNPITQLKIDLFMTTNID